jgi:hypothetical protein
MPVSVTVRSTPGGVGKLLSRVRAFGKDDADDRVKAVLERLRRAPTPAAEKSQEPEATK